MGPTASDHAHPLAEPLRLLACDEDDLTVLSAHLQDATLRVADMAYVPADRRFALLADRFDRCCQEGARVRAGLHFDYVLAVSRTGFQPNEPEAVLNLLSITFTADDAPSGTVLLTFSGGAGVKLTVECLDAQLRDLGPRWTDARRPAHAVDDGATG